MRIRKLEIVGFRGALPPLPLALNEKSTCIYGENGFGKSTIADALELWSRGEVAAFHRAGCQLDAAIHIDATEAAVTVQPTGSGELRRILPGLKASDLEVVSGRADPASAAGLPLLRHETVRDFMQKSGGEKKRELLELVGLESLNDFRDALRSAKTVGKRARENAATAEAAERRLLEEKCDAQGILSTAESLRTEAELSTAIISEQDLRDLQLQPAPQAEGPNRLATIDELDLALGEVAAHSTALWNELIADREAVQQKALSALLREGESLIVNWSQDTCPLCGSVYPREQLQGELGERVAALGQVEGRFEAALAPLAETCAAWQALAEAIDALSKNPPPTGWPNADSLTTTGATASAYADELEAAGKAFAAAPEPPASTLAEEIAAMREAATSAVNPQTKALLLLAALQGQLGKVDGAAAATAAAQWAEDAADRLLEIADAAIEGAIGAAISDLGGLVSRYYLMLSGSRIYSDVKLVYDPKKRAGEAEFSVRYDDREDTNPPQRIMSNGQLNGLALAFFLARTKTEDQRWRTIVLDDVVSSFGGAHRRGLLDLLDSEFADWQVILLTHDRTFAQLAQARLGAGWVHRQISQWTPTGGPVIVEGDPLRRLRQRLDAGEGAAELGSIAREALESGLAQPLERLQYPIEYRAQARYTGKEYLIALRKGLSAADSTLAEAPVLARLEADVFVTNLGSHYQPDLGGAETSDLERLADDLDEVRELFTCGSCKLPVWNRGRGPGRHTCHCKALAA
jgi:hypothetical protein